MKTLIRIIIALVAIAGLSLAFSDNAPDRPLGVSADHWAPISANLGVVLIPDTELSTHSGLPKVMNSGDGTTLIAPTTPTVQTLIEEGQPVRGYIMVKRGKVWRPLQVVAPTVSG
jgi:hypothetical protein